MKAITCDVGPGRASWSSQGAASTLGANGAAPAPTGQNSTRGFVVRPGAICPWLFTDAPTGHISTRGFVVRPGAICPWLSTDAPTGQKPRADAPCQAVSRPLQGRFMAPEGPRSIARGGHAPGSEREPNQSPSSLPEVALIELEDYASSEMPRILPETWWSDDALPGSRCIA